MPRRDPFEQEVREQLKPKRGGGPGLTRGKGYVMGARWGNYGGYGSYAHGYDQAPGDDRDHLNGDQFSGDYGEGYGGVGDAPTDGNYDGGGGAALGDSGGGDGGGAL